MKRITLFSTLTNSNEQTILNQILPAELTNKSIAYMPSEGIQGAQEYIKQWEGIAQRYDATFQVINNLRQSIEEKDKLLASNVLVISGGNTFNLMHNLRESGLDKTIKQFMNKSDFVVSGFSAGAIALTPSIKICNLPIFDENLIDLKALEALNIVDFEVFPHYNESLHKEMLKNYRKTTSNRVHEITDEIYISIDK